MQRKHLIYILVIELILSVFILAKKRQQPAIVPQELPESLATPPTEPEKHNYYETLQLHIENAVLYNPQQENNDLVFVLFEFFTDAGAAAYFQYVDSTLSFINPKENVLFTKYPKEEDLARSDKIFQLLADYPGIEIPVKNKHLGLLNKSRELRIYCRTNAGEQNCYLINSDNKEGETEQQLIRLLEATLQANGWTHSPKVVLNNDSI